MPARKDGPLAASTPRGLRPQAGEPRGPRRGRQPAMAPRGQPERTPGEERTATPARGAGGRRAGDNKAFAAAAPSPPFPPPRQTTRCCGARKAPHFGHARRRRHPRSARRRAGTSGGVNLRDDPVSTGAFAGPAPAGTALSPATNPLPLFPPPGGPRTSAPADPLPGTQGCPAGCRPPPRSTPGALAPAPTHFRVQPPSLGVGPTDHVTARAAAQPPGFPARGPAPATAHVRAPRCAQSP